MWISAKKELPELPDGDYVSTIVLACWKDYYGKLTTHAMIYERVLKRGVRTERWKWVFDRIFDGEILYWMPLPAPPDENFVLSDVNDVRLHNHKDYSRGINGDNFVYGFLTKDSEGNRFINSGTMSYLVDPKTVGHCSTVCDVNGVPIYEGDIITGIMRDITQIKAVCVFRDGAFGLYWKYGGRVEFHAFTSICHVEYEVVGNIHESPENFLTEISLEELV